MRFPVHPVPLTILTLGFAFASLAFGWWAVVAVGIVWGNVVRRTDRPVPAAAATASVAWVGVLGLTGSEGPVGDLAGLFRAVLPLPMPALYVFAIAAGGGLAAAGATLIIRPRGRPAWVGGERRSGAHAAVDPPTAAPGSATEPTESTETDASDHP